MERLHTLDHLTLAAVKCTDRALADAWEATTAERLDGAGGGLFRIDPPAPVGRPGAGHSHVAIAGAAALPAAGFAAGHAAIRTDGWIRHGATATTDPEAGVTALIVAEVLSADPARTAEWDDWYDDVHLPDMMACGAFVGGTRWRRPEPRPGTANHLTIYEIGDLPLAEAIDRSAAIVPGLVAAGRKLDCHTGGLTLGLVRV